MKRFNQGFTLAEVLITLTVIGVISAITLPSTLSNYQQKTVGVKLSKFAAQLENAAVPYVAENDIFANNAQVSKFINKTFLIKSISGDTENSSSSGGAVKYSFSNEKSPVAMLKDGTAFQVSMNSDLKFTNHASRIDIYKVGAPKFDIRFYPHVKGLPSFVQKNYDFTVTEMGYVFPKDTDNCLWMIYDNDYTTNGDVFSEGTACVANTTGSGNNVIIDPSKYMDYFNTKTPTNMTNGSISEEYEQVNGLINATQNVINNNIQTNFNTFAK